jgi:hypothetical protein
VAPQWQSYARERGLFYYANWTIPQITQLLHHSEFGDVPNLVMGDLPGALGDAQMAHFRLDPGNDKRCYTVVVVSAPESVNYAVRVMCHDRDMSKRDASNPDADLQTIEMADRDVPVESEAFLRRYDVSTDHDQDQIRAWQLFDPALIHWLTESAPENFSFELQNGALCAFVPGALADPAALDGLCDAAAVVHTRLLEIGDDHAAAAPVAGSRADIVDRELAEHPFERPPRSARAAAFHFGIPLISRESRRLGAEAFFRAHVEALGLKRMDPSAFMATHIDIAIPGEVTQVARGHLPHTEALEGYLVFTTDPGAGGWSVVLADITQEDNGFAFAVMGGREDWEKDGLDVSSNGSTITVWKPDGSPFSKTARKLDRFLADACPVLERAYAAAKHRPGDP